MKRLIDDHPWAFEEAVRLAGRKGDEAAFARELEDAMWAGDCDRLHELAGCRCCCWEHTFEGCPARVWDGCRGSGMTTRADLESWMAHYERFHGLPRDQF
jgi:hypothetical protein